MSRRIRKTILVALVAAACLLVAIVALVLKTVPHAKPPLVTLVGITEAVGQGKTATFAVSNPNRRGILFVAAHPEARMHGVWPTPSHPPFVDFLGVNPRDETRFTVAVPTNGTPWRQPVTWFVQPNLLEVGREIVVWNFRSLRGTGSLVGMQIDFLRMTTNPPVYSGEIARQ